MNNKYTNLYYELLSLSVYRDFIYEEVGAGLLAFLESIVDDESDNIKVSAYSDFVSALFKEGGNISEYVKKYLKTSNDSFLKMVITDKFIPEQVADAHSRDLYVMQEVSDLKASDLLKLLKTHIIMPEFANTEYNIISEYNSMIADVKTKGYGIFADSAMFRIKDEELVPVINPEFQRLDQFYGYKLEREQVLKNTEALALGRNASNVLLYGDAGTGKSSTVKACAAAFFDQGVRLIEFKKDEVDMIPELAEELRESPLKFIFYIDDLSFSDDDDNFYALKGVLEGNISGCSNNIVIYATSNRRHLVRESMEARQGSDLHLNDTLQEMMSLSARFGLTITFSKPAKDLYVEIVLQLADEYGLEYEEADLIKRAEAFAIRANGRSPRTAKQFIILATNNMR